MSPKNAATGRRTLESWKEIAGYLGKGVTTVQRWEKEEGLPVRRHTHQSLGTVYAFPDELDAWRATRGSQPASGVQPPRRNREWIWPSAAVILLAIAGAGWLIGGRSLREPAPGTSFFLATSGVAKQVRVSPDGRSVVYITSGKDGRTGNPLYIKPVDGGDERRLTSYQADDRWPRWSPDGALIAFARRNGNDIDIYTIPAVGGQERRIAGVINGGLSSLGEVNWVTWAADSKSLIVVDRRSSSEPLALHLVPLDTRTRRQLTDPPSNIVGDTIADVSPDGRSLAFVRWSTGFEADLYVTSLEGGAARRLTSDRAAIYGLTWTPHGEDILFSSSRMSALNTLWRVSAFGSRPPQRIAGVIDESVWPSAAKVSGDAGFRIAHHSITRSVNLMQLKSAQGPEGKPSPVCASTRFDWQAQLSPDGSQIAFSSTRGGSSNIWICEPDGRARQITFLSGSYTDSPRWSPDGRRLAFTSREGESREVFLANLDTREIRPLTHESSDEGRASFSRDGEWIYFRSNRSGRDEIWKMHSTGGAARQITRAGAREGFESPDGRLLYFVKERPQLGVWSVPSDGGVESRVTDGGRDTRWAVSRDGIYFVTPGAPYDVMMYRYDTRTTRPLYRISDSAGVWAGFTVSFDGATIVWPQTVRDSSDIAILDRVK